MAGKIYWVQHGNHSCSTQDLDPPDRHQNPGPTIGSMEYQITEPPGKSLNFNLTGFNRHFGLGKKLRSRYSSAIVAPETGGTKGKSLYSVFFFCPFHMREPESHGFLIRLLRQLYLFTIFTSYFTDYCPFIIVSSKMFRARKRTEGVWKEISD